VLQSTEPVYPVNIGTSVEGARLDPKVCPHNNKILAFINKGDIWVSNLDNGQEMRLTFTKKGKNKTRIEDYLLHQCNYRKKIYKYSVQSSFGNDDRELCSHLTKIFFYM
jgi:hypothetical protein